METVGPGVAESSERFLMVVVLDVYRAINYIWRRSKLIWRRGRSRMWSSLLEAT